MQILNLFLTALFAIHCIVFLRLYLKRKSIRYLYLVGTFSLLTIAFGMLAADYRLEVNLLFITLQLPTVLRLLAVLTTATAIYLFFRDRKARKSDR